MYVRWLKRALADLDSEAEYIAQESVKSAHKVVSRIYRSVENLKKYPLIGREGRVPGTREIIVPGFSYIIPYRLRKGHIEVLRVFHTSRKWPEKPS